MAAQWDRLLELDAQLEALGIGWALHDRTADGVGGWELVSYHVRSPEVRSYTFTNSPEYCLEVALRSEREMLRFLRGEGPFPYQMPPLGWR